MNYRAETIDSRDVIDRIEELEALAAEGALEPGEGEELAILQAFAEEACEVPDWAYGEIFVRESYFVTYAQELADDMGLFPLDYQWPLSCIDWDQAARELQVDYTEYEIDGVTYWARA